MVPQTNMKVPVITIALVFIQIAAFSNAEFLMNRTNKCTAEECYSFCPHDDRSTCKDPCLRTQAEGCFKSCGSENCEVRCGPNSDCTFLCLHKRCERIVSFGGKECHHICNGECPRIECRCKQCYFYKYYTPNASPLNKNYFYCKSNVEQCNLLCDNSTCIVQSFGKYVHGNVINKGNAFFELAETVRRINLNCAGSTSLCMLLQRLETTKYYSLCHENCGYTGIYQTHYFHTERRLLMTTMIDHILEQKQRYPQKGPDNFVRDAFIAVSRFIKSPEKPNDWYFRDLKFKEYPSFNQPSHKPTPVETLQGDGSAKNTIRRNSGPISTRQTSWLCIIVTLVQLLFVLTNQDLKT